MDSAELHRALESPDAYPALAAAARPGREGSRSSGPEPQPSASRAVEVIETHLSRLYFVGERVFKVKKAVDLGFVDFSTLEKRRDACEAEVRLNGRLAPGVYVGVVPIVLDRAGRPRVGAAPAAEPAPEPVEYAVEMARLPAGQMLERRLERGEIDAGFVERLAALLADFHARAARGPEIDRFAAPDAVAARVQENLAESEAAARRLDELLPAATNTLPPRIADFLRGAFTRFAREERPRFERRLAQSRICEGHGDLHAGNVCVLPDRIVAFDCIEFSLALRCLDAAADLAFLLMDLDRLGFPAFARDLARRYALRAADPELPGLLPFYKAHLACVRGKVAALRGLGSGDASVRARSRCEAQRFFALAARYALPPFLAATCGLPGSGKSHAARRVARALDAAHVQSDFERKRLAGVPPTARVPAAREAEVYSAPMTERTYVQLFAEGRRELGAGRAALLDATFPTAALRERAAAAARAAGAPFVLIHCRVGEAEARRRLEARAGERDQFSDADVAVYERARARFEPPLEIPPARLVEAGADLEAEELLLALLEGVVAQLKEAGRLPATFPLA
jgi:hypothetical protein